MPENQEEEVLETSPEETEDVTQYSALDALKELHPEEPEPEQEQEETEPETDESDGDEADEEPTEDEDEVPALHEDVLSTLKEHNPEAIKSWENNWKGLQKREQKVSAVEAQIAALGESPETARETLTGFIEGLAEHFATTPEELMGWTATKPSESPAEEPDEMEFVTDAERFAVQKAKELDRKLAEVEKRLQRQDEEAKHARLQAEQTAFVDRVAPKVSKLAEKSYNGFSVSREMVAEAVRSDATLIGAPPERVAEAVLGRNVAKVYAHATKSAREQSAKRAPEMLPKVTGRGAAVKPAEDYSALDALAELSERRR